MADENEKVKTVEETTETVKTEVPSGPGVAEGVEPHEAPTKKELSPEEREQHTRMVIAQQTIDREKELSELLEDLKSKGYLDHGYKSDTMVEIPANIFTHLLDYLATVEDHNLRIRGILASIADASASVSLGALDFRTELTRIHGENCEKGITMTPEEIEADIAASSAIEEVQNERKPKARGTDSEEVEQRPAPEASEEE